MRLFHILLLPLCLLFALVGPGAGLVGALFFGNVMCPTGLCYFNRCPKKLKQVAKCEHYEQVCCE